MVTQSGAVYSPPSTQEAAVVASQYAQLTDGNVWYVNSGGPSAGNGKRPGSSFRTLAAAEAAASAGDTVLVMEGHAETIAGATTWVPAKAGISYIGLGTGARRPTLTFSATDSEVPISGAGVIVRNFLCIAGAVDVVVGITVSGADVQLIDIEMQEPGATSQFVIGITLTTGAARCYIERFIFRGFITGDANTQAIGCAVALDGVRIIDPIIDGLHSNGSIYNVTTAMTNLLIAFTGRGHIRQRHATRDSGISVVSTTTGQILSPRIRTATNDADGFNLAIVAAAMQVYDPLVVNADGERGGAWGTASAAA